VQEEGFGLIRLVVGEGDRIGPESACHARKRRVSFPACRLFQPDARVAVTHTGLYALPDELDAQALNLLGHTHLFLARFRPETVVDVNRNHPCHFLPRELGKNAGQGERIDSTGHANNDRRHACQRDGSHPRPDTLNQPRFTVLPVTSQDPLHRVFSREMVATGGFEPPAKGL
jgi:hypothetical protein